MDFASHINRSRSDLSGLLAGALRSVDRFLLVLVAIELISMPFTQYAWTWDHFLRGGMDFESSLLFLVVCLHLLFVLRNHRRQDENLHVPMGWLSLTIFDSLKSAAMRGTEHLLLFIESVELVLAGRRVAFLFKSDPVPPVAFLLDGPPVQVIRLS